MKLVIIESPYAGDVERNVKFAERACRLATLAGFAPLASHLIYTRFLDDENPEERRLGIVAGLAWADKADEVWVCLRGDEIPSAGMVLAMERHRKKGLPMALMQFDAEGERALSLDYNVLKRVEL